MKLIKLFSTVVFLVLQVIPVALAQKVENINPKVINDEIVIHYDLIGSHPKESYLVKPYLVNKELSPLKLVTGQQGYNVFPGQNEIKWDFQNELINFDGDLQFQIEATPIFQTPKKGLKRGKTYELKWLPQINTEFTNLSLLMGNNEILNYEIDNSTTATITIPDKAKIDKYYIQISGQNNAEPIVLGSNQFKVKRKVSLFVKALPVIIVGAFIGYRIYYKNNLEPLPEPASPQILFGN